MYSKDSQACLQSQKCLYSACTNDMGSLSVLSNNEVPHLLLSVNFPKMA